MRRDLVRVERTPGSLHPNCKKHFKQKVPWLTQNTTCKHEYLFGVIQGTFGVIQGTFGVIQRTFGVIQRTFGVIPGTFSVIQGTFSVIQGTFGVIQGTFGVIQGTFTHHHRVLVPLGQPLLQLPFELAAEVSKLRVLLGRGL